MWGFKIWFIMEKYQYKPHRMKKKAQWHTLIILGLPTLCTETICWLWPCSTHNFISWIPSFTLTSLFPETFISATLCLSSCCACVAQMSGGGVRSFWGALRSKCPPGRGFPLLLQPAKPRQLPPRRAPTWACAHMYVVRHFAAFSEWAERFICRKGFWNLGLNPMISPQGPFGWG